GQLAHAREVAEEVVALRAAGHELVLTHGNGPQVGALALAMPEQSLDVLTAMTQGQIGYLLETALGPDVPSAALLTRVVVDPGDPAFARPTKPVGPFYAGEEARRLALERGWAVADDAGRGWRRIVPSPRPVRVLGADNVRTLLDADVVVIAAGGGGIPVDDEATGLAGVIDKDRCSAELARAIGADLLVMLTGVPRVALDYGTRWERELSAITVAEAERAMADGEFPPGSMGPKIEAAGRFVGAGGGRAVITAPGRMLAAVAGEDGTWVVPEAVPA
ncbi:MAG TPA: carbamate kinase, partial [Solirubrobacteraceae bacterium]|nr:carbamate kinase [Solirubrobacteraceae bacterium]